jgi:hypothetical protein
MENMKPASPLPWRVSDSHGLCIRSGDAYLPNMVLDGSPGATMGNWLAKRADVDYAVHAANNYAAALARAESAERERDEAREIAAQWHEAASNGACSHYMTGLWMGDDASKADHARHGKVIDSWK